ncbi:MAG: threonine/serine dehydratase, partial [Cellvibrionaceae bacterium]|nr:threonine/serine dehydratase [Cellvibrionaceae bacterium]
MSETSYRDIELAADRIAGKALQTPLLQSPELNRRCAAEVYIKAESLQRVGAFKFRGAYNRLVQLDTNERSKGVVAWSSGNHAQGVAAAAQLLGVHATIVMPADAPKIKIENTQSYGAEIIFYDRYRQDREQIARQIAAERGAVLVPSYDDPHIIAGQGTVGLEIAQQCDKLDAVLVPIGGGGLAAGTFIALAQGQTPECIGVEPEQFNDTQRSFAAGKRQTLAGSQTSICDALLAPCPGELTFPILQRYMHSVLTVSDAEVAAAVYFAWCELKLVLEPGGAVALAALLAGKYETAG